MPKKKGDKLNSLLVSIDDSLKKQNSTWRVFVNGLVRGFGTALGATVVLAILTSMTFKAVESLDPEKLINFFMDDVTSN